MFAGLVLAELLRMLFGFGPTPTPPPPDLCPPMTYASVVDGEVYCIEPAR